jgi:hypothetical protein
MLEIANKHALVEEATLGTREVKKDKKSSHQESGTSKLQDKKRKPERMVANVKSSDHPHHFKPEYRPWPGEFNVFPDGKCIFHPQGRHKIRDCFKLLGFAYVAKKMAQEPKPDEAAKDQKDDFPEPEKEVNYIFDGSDCYESKCKQKLEAREVMMVGEPSIPQYLRWLEVPITFD